MKSTTNETMRALSDPAIRDHVLQCMREGLWQLRTELGLSRPTMATLDEQLQSPPMLLYTNGSCEVVAPAIGFDRAPTFDWPDLKVRLVAEAGYGSLIAGSVVWSNVSQAANP